MCVVLTVVFLTSCDRHDDSQVSNNLQVHDNLHTRVHQLLLLWNSRYPELEASLNDQYGLYRNGKLSGREFSNQIFFLEYANEGAEAKFVGYEQAMPDSKWAHLLHGLYLNRLAVDARGQEVVSKTPRQNFNKMRELALQANDLLAIAHQHQAPFSLYAGGMVEVNRMLNTQEGNKLLVDEAIAGDHDVWRAPYNYFLTLYPQWGGSEEAMKAYISEVKPNNPKLANALQAKFYWRKGKKYSVDGDTDLAVLQYKLAADTSPDVNTLKDLGEIYLQKNQCDDAVKVLNRNLTENDEWDTWTLNALKQAYDCSGDSWQAKQVQLKIDELYARYSQGE